MNAKVHSGFHFTYLLGKIHAYVMGTLLNRGTKVACYCVLLWHQGSMLLCVTGTKVACYCVLLWHQGSILLCVTVAPRQHTIVTTVAPM